MGMGLRDRSGGVLGLCIFLGWGGGLYLGVRVGGIIFGLLGGGFDCIWSLYICVCTI